MHSGLYGIPRGGNREVLTLKRGPDIGFTMGARYGDTLLNIPVPLIRPTNENSAIAMDLGPSGPVPAAFGANGLSWFDLNDSDVYDSNYNNGVLIPLHCMRIGNLGTAGQVGPINFNGATDIPLQFIVGSNVTTGIKGYIDTTGTLTMGRGADVPIFGSGPFIGNVAGGSSLTLRDSLDHSEFFVIASTPSVYFGSSTNHPLVVRTNNVDRATFDTSGNLSGLLSLQRTGGVAIQGSNTNDSAAAGYVGEYISSSVAVGSAAAMTTGVPQNVTSISLTAGDWDVTAQAYVLLAATTNMTNFQYSISSTSATLDFNPGKWNTVQNAAAGIVYGNKNLTFGALSFRISLAAPGTVYLVSQDDFTVSSASTWGFIGARRKR